MPSDFLMQIINRHTGEVVATWEPGSRVEADVVTHCLQIAKQRGIGFWRTEARVTAVLHAAWHEAIHALKSQVIALHH